MQRETSKTIEIGGLTYRLNKMTAATASWIRGLLMSANASYMMRQRDVPDLEEPKEPPAPEVQADMSVVFFWTLCATELPEGVYRRVQNCAMEVCFQIPSLADAAPVAVLMKDGRVAVPELRDDAVSFNKLIEESLKFNLSAFFLVAPLNAATTAVA